MSVPIPLYCECEDCQPNPLPWAHIEDGCLVITSRHHGRKHTNRIPIDKLYQMCYNGTHNVDTEADTTAA